MSREADGTNNFNTAPFFLKFPDRYGPDESGTIRNYTEYCNPEIIQDWPDQTMASRPVDIQGIKSLSVQLRAQSEDDYFPAIEVIPQISNSGSDDDMEWFDIPADSFNPELVQPLIGNGTKNALLVVNQTRAKYFRLKMIYVDEAAPAGMLWAYCLLGEI